MTKFYYVFIRENNIWSLFFGDDKLNIVKDLFSTIRIQYDILDWLNQSKTPVHFEFPLTNLPKGPMIDFVPQSKHLYLSNFIIYWFNKSKLSNIRQGEDNQ